MCDSVRTGSVVVRVGRSQVWRSVRASGCGLDRCPREETGVACKQDVQESRSRRRESLCRATLRLRLSRPRLLQSSQVCVRQVKHSAARHQCRHSRNCSCRRLLLKIQVKCVFAAAVIAVAAETVCVAVKQQLTCQASVVAASP